MSDTTETEAAAALARLTAQPITLPGGGMFLLRPAEDNAAEIADLEQFAPAPRLVRADPVLATLEDFIGYMNRYHVDGVSVVFADVTGPRMTGVVDYHSTNNEPSHERHRPSYRMRFDPAWLAWAGIHDRMMTQSELGQFIEENINDVIEPDGAKMLTIVTKFDLERKVTFRAATRLDNSTVQLTYNEEDTPKGGGGTGTIDIPKEIKLGVPIFYGDKARTPVKAFFRYRITDGRLAMGIHLHRMQEVVDDAFREVVMQARDEMPGITVFEGSP